MAITFFTAGPMMRLLGSSPARAHDVSRYSSSLKPIRAEGAGYLCNADEHPKQKKMGDRLLSVVMFQAWLTVQEKWVLGEQ